MAAKSGVTNISWIGTWGIEVSEILFSEGDGHQFVYSLPVQWIWTRFVQVLCMGGVCLN